jgi:hypothetical protein
VSSRKGIEDYFMNLFKLAVSRLATMTLTLAIVTGCGGNLGVPYVPVAATNNRGFVYVYRPAKHKGSALNLGVIITDEGQTPADQGTVVGFIENNGYVPLTALGKTRITFPYAKKSVDLDVEAGKSYYVRIAVAPGMFDPPENGTIELVAEAAARPEIAEAKIQEHTYRGK